MFAHHPSQSIAAPFMYMYSRAHTLQVLKTSEPGDWDEWIITHSDTICVSSASLSDGAIAMTIRYAGPRWYSRVRVPQEWHRDTDLHDL